MKAKTEGEKPLKRGTPGKGGTERCRKKESPFSTARNGGATAVPDPLQRQGLSTAMTPPHPKTGIQQEGVPIRAPPMPTHPAVAFGTNLG